MHAPGTISARCSETGADRNQVLERLIRQSFPEAVSPQVMDAIPAAELILWPKLSPPPSRPQKEGDSEPDVLISPNPPTRVVGVADREIRDMEARLSGRFWTVGVSGRSAVVVSSRSPRDRTQQKTLTGRSGAGLARVLGDVRVAGGRGWRAGCRRPPSGWEWNGSQSGQGATELGFPGPALG